MADNPNLTGHEVERLHRALLSAFNLGTMTQLVAFKFQPPANTIVPVPPVGPFGNFLQPTYQERVLALIMKAEEEGWTDALIEEAHKQVPGNPLLRQFYQHYAGSVQRRAPGHALQRIVDEGNSMLQPAIWREKLGALERTVCCIECGGKPAGTGFLVAPTIVLTNYHVMEPVIDGEAAAGNVTLRFDYKRLGNTVLNGGLTHKLGAKWDLAKSPYSDADSDVDPASLDAARKGEPKSAEPDANELDYAFVELDAEASADTVFGQPRGFVPPPVNASPPWSPRTALNILQHPSGKPLELALDPYAIIRANAANTRVRYRTNTESGSSGSPCFDKDWNLVALHHSGDPDFSRVADYNEGIPIHTIREDLSPELRQRLNW